MGELLHEEGISRGAVEDEVPQFRGYVSSVQDGLAPARHWSWRVS